MEIEKEEKKINWKAYLIASGISLAVGFLIFILFFWILKRPLIDGFTYAAIILISAGLLTFVAKEGFFDFASFGFKQLGSILFNKNANKMNDYPTYLEQNRQKRAKQSKLYISIILAGVVYLICTFVALIII